MIISGFLYLCAYTTSDTAAPNHFAIQPSPQLGVSIVPVKKSPRLEGYSPVCYLGSPLPTSL